MSESGIGNPEKPAAQTDRKLKEPVDPLGVMIVPIFGIVLVAVVFLWFTQKEEEVESGFFPVTGRVTFQGKPLEPSKFHIDFYPVEGSSNPVASAWIVEDGEYELYSGQLGHYGAQPGEYRVTVSMMETEEMKSWRIEAARAGFIEIDPIDGGTVTPPDPPPPFDSRFSDPRKTPQRAVVTQSNNRINLELPPPKKPAAKQQKTKKKEKPATSGEGQKAGKSSAEKAATGTEKDADPRKASDNKASDKAESVPPAKKDSSSGDKS